MIELLDAGAVAAQENRGDVEAVPSIRHMPLAPVCGEIADTWKVACRVGFCPARDESGRWPVLCGSQCHRGKI